MSAGVYIMRCFYGYLGRGAAAVSGSVDRQSLTSQSVVLDLLTSHLPLVVIWENNRNGFVSSNLYDVLLIHPQISLHASSEKLL